MTRTPVAVAALLILTILLLHLIYLFDIHITQSAVEKHNFVNQSFSEP